MLKCYKLTALMANKYHIHAREVIILLKNFRQVIGNLFFSLSPTWFRIPSDIFTIIGTPTNGSDSTSLPIRIHYLPITSQSSKLPVKYSRLQILQLSLSWLSRGYFGYIWNLRDSFIFSKDTSFNIIFQRNTVGILLNGRIGLMWQWETLPSSI